MIDPLPLTATAHRRPVIFARHARAAIEMHVPQARENSAHWNLGTNEAWVRFRREDGLFGYFALRRHLDWVSGEAGLSRAPHSLGELALTPGATGEVAGYRIRLGDLLHGRDRWWPVGENASEMEERLRYLALQLAVKGGAHFRRWPGGER